MGSLQNSNGGPPLKVLIVGCGLGGLSCAISCLKEGLEVKIVEQAPELGEVGAGIQVPPNAVRVLDHYGLVPKLVEAGAVKLEKHCLLRYFDGRPIATRPGAAWLTQHFGHPWYVVHRADYHRVLVEETRRLGATIQLNSEVRGVDFEQTSVVLASGEEIHADTIIGADGLRSVVRNDILGYDSPPVETGDLAYRATIPRSRVEALDPSLQESKVSVWVGPNRHAVMYPVRNKTVFNLVLACPDDLPPNVATAKGNVEEMRNLFKGWDPRLTALLAQVDNVLKWKICHMEELDCWCKESVALLGDACHPTLPYQSQGAAMAVEDGATLGILLGRLSRSPVIDPVNRASHIPGVLKLYESLRKKRTTTNVQGAIQNRQLYHMVDGPECDARNEVFATVDWDRADSNFPWGWANLKYLKDLMGFDTISDAAGHFDEWVVRGKE